MKITIDVAPVTPEAKQAIEDAWVVILRAELEARAQEPEGLQAQQDHDQAVDDPKKAELPMVGMAITSSRQPTTIP